MPYTASIDIWSFGCILVELYTGLPIFPAENEKELVSCIVEVLGIPPLELIKSGTRTNLYFNTEGEAIPYVNKRGKQRIPGTRSIKTILKGADREFIKIVQDCLQWNPIMRANPENTLKSDWFIDNSSRKINRKSKINIEDITKYAPKLQKYIPDIHIIQKSLK